MTDPIADMLTRIRNATLVHKAELTLPYSKVKLAIAKILQREGYLAEVEHLPGEKVKDGETRFPALRLKLLYREDGRPAITHVARVSRPGSRRYVGKQEIPHVRNGFGVAIVSTPKGLMSGNEARKHGMGGEVICELY